LFKRNIIIILVILVIIGGLFGTKFLQINNAMQSRKAPPPATVTTTRVISETWQPSVPAIGSVTATEGIVLSNEFAGIVSAIHFKSGQAVNKGDLLIELDTSTDKAELKGLLASQKLAQLKYKRQVKLLKTKSTSKSNRDEALAILDQAIAAVSTKQSIINKKMIQAPFSGIIGIRNVDIGQYLDKGFSIAPLQSLAPVYADFTLAERHFSKLALGQTVNISVDAYPNQRFAGLVTAIDPGVEESTRAVRLRATINNSEKLLRPGMFTEIELLTTKPQPYLTLPDTAITYNTYGENVYIIIEKDGKNIAQHRTIKTGKKQQGRTAITEGLSLNDQVVNEGQVKLRNNIPVTIVPPKKTNSVREK